MTFVLGGRRPGSGAVLRGDADAGEAANWENVATRAVADATRVFEAGEALGEYYGQVLSLWQAMNLENRDYLMGGFG